MDIISLYEYSAELTDYFPKDVLHVSCMDRYIKWSKSLNSKNHRDNDIPPECNGVSHLVTIAHVTELKEQITEERKIRKEVRIE
jgi:hypothetical protein